MADDEGLPVEGEELEPDENLVEDEEPEEEVGDEEPEEDEDLPELVKGMSSEEKLEKVAELLDYHEHAYQLTSGMLNMFTELRKVLAS